MSEASSVSIPPVARREVLLASAGSGKTHELSSRLIALLATDVAPQDILASTFTRKAAGEITDRVLARLAEAATDSRGAERLAESMPPGVPRDGLTRERWTQLLCSVIGQLHRLQVLTLDAFFYRISRAFALDLGLPQRWRLAEDPDRARLCSRAIESVLREVDPEALAEVVRRAGRSVADRNVHRLLLEGVEKLYGVFRELDPQAQDPWGTASNRVPEPDLGPLERLIALLDQAEVPKTAAGTPNKSWLKARRDATAALREGDWERFLTTGLAAAIVTRGGVYGGKEIPRATRNVLDPLIDVAAAALLAEHSRRIAAIGRFLPEYDQRVQRIQREEGLYHFEDLTHALSRMDRDAGPSELHYRLDQRVFHMLLDEFQDTSNAQWAALAPLTGDLLSEGGSGRALFVVADPKQSIYGWRGGEPRLLDDIQERLGLRAESTSRSWRSSAAILETVNEVFLGIEQSEVLSRERDAVRSWTRSFEAHHPARELTGYVHVEVGPDDGRPQRSLRPALLAHAAGEIARLHGAAPGARLGVLTRTNRSAAFLFAHLRTAGIDASEEGGVPVADSAPVLAILALLRLVDHPEDTISRYLVEKTPVAALLGLSPDEGRDPEARIRAIRLLRDRLLREGYGRLLSDWARRLGEAVSERDRRRLRQLSELGFRWDERATSRPSDFVRVAEVARAEDPASAAVRVMTIHGAKGLEFDAVVLPDLDDLWLARDRSDSYIAYRDGGTGPVQRVLPRLNDALLPLYPQLAPATQQAKESEVRDGLSTLYVGLTRAKHALYVYMSPDPKGTSSARTGARVLREALASGPAVSGEVLYTRGSSEWWKTLSPRKALPPRAVEGRPGLRREEKVRLTTGPRRRMLPHRAPSELGGLPVSSLASRLRPEARRSRKDGVAIHLWLAEIQWIEAGLPPDSHLLARASGLLPGGQQLPDLLARFHQWLAHSEIHRLLSEGAFPEGASVQRELPFIIRERDELIEGRVDRLIRVPEPGGTRLVVIDWKTEVVEPGDTAARARAIERYGPQVRAYVRALAKSENVALEQVEGLLAFVPTGVVARVPGDT